MAATTSFSYTISDGSNQSTAFVTVNIEDVTTIPNAVAQGESRTVQQGQSILVNVLSNDTPSGVVIDAIITPPTKGNASIESGQIRYTPISGQLGADSLVYRIRLPANNSTATATLSITITGQPGTTDLFLTPFNRLSRFHMPLGTGLTSANDAACQSLRLVPGVQHINVDNGFGANMYRAVASDPTKTIQWNGDGSGINLPHTCKVPANAVFGNLSPSAIDRYCIIMQPDGKTCVEIRGYNNNPANPACAGVRPWDASGRGHRAPNTHEDWGFSASGMAKLCGLIRGHEWNSSSGDTHHAFQLALRYRGNQATAPIMSRNFIYPANNTDGRCKTDNTACTGNVDYGMCFHLPTSVNIDALGLSPHGKKVARCLRDYGIYAMEGTNGSGIRADQHLTSAANNALQTAFDILWEHLRHVTNSTFEANGCVGGGSPLGINTAWDA